MKIRHYTWSILNGLQSLPIFTFKLRTRLLKLYGIKISSSSNIAENVYIGSNKIEIGPNVFINVGAFLDGSGPIILGNYVRIGPYCKILTASHTINNGYLRRSGTSKLVINPVIIEDGVWVGMGAIILPGVTIKRGCVIGAGSVVTKSTEENGLYVGNPAILKFILEVVD